MSVSESVKEKKWFWGIIYGFVGICFVGVAIGVMIVVKRRKHVEGLGIDNLKTCERCYVNE